MSYSDTSGRSDQYNLAAGHDSGFYDPDRHDNQIVAVFENEQAARQARDNLVSGGVPAEAVEVVGHVEGDAAPGQSHAEDGAPSETVGDSVLGAFMSLFTPAEEHGNYDHAVRQGHAMVVVRPTPQTDRHEAIRLLEQSGPIDFDAKLAEWRQTGYDQSGAARAGGERRVGRRETMAQEGAEQGGRVRSYVADKPEGTMGTGGDVTNATPGATTSGMNSPRT